MVGGGPTAPRSPWAYQQVKEAPIGTHADAGPNKPASRGARTIQSAATICAAKMQMDLSVRTLKPHIRHLHASIFSPMNGK